MCHWGFYKNKSIIITGGYGDTTPTLDTVIRYDEDGFVEYLPKLNYPRSGDGCAGYYDDSDKLKKAK